MTSHGFERLDRTSRDVVLNVSSRTGGTDVSVSASYVSFTTLIGAQATTAPDDLARRLTHYVGFGRPLSGREHELLEFAGRVVTIRERQIAADIADGFRQASASSDPPAVGRLLFAELYERLSRRPRNPGSPDRQHMDE